MAEAGQKKRRDVPHDAVRFTCTRAKQNNVVLIGMPGVGKSTIAKRLCRAAGMELLDTDRFIVEKNEKKILTLLGELGPDGFVAMENEICSALHVNNTVIATGGSVVYGEEAMRNLSENGCVVYLKLAFPLLRERLERTAATRGIVLHEGQTLYDLYRERVPLYEKYADIIIDEHSCYPTRTAERVFIALRRYGFFRGKRLPFVPQRQLFSQKGGVEAQKGLDEKKNQTE